MLVIVIASAVATSFVATAALTIGATTASAASTNTGVLAIGRTGASGTGCFNDAIDEVALYPTALSAGRVAAHFAAGSTPPGP